MTDDNNREIEGEIDGELRERPAVAEVLPEPGQGDSLASASRSTFARPSLLVLVRAGLRALRRFPGLVASLYLLQLALSAGAAVLMGMLLMRAFGDRPLFDRAMDGDLAALVTCLSDPAGGSALVALVWIGAATVLIYGVLSWFLSAGLIAVLLDAPSRRREVVRWFGAAGAANFFPFLRLSLWSIIPYLPVLLAAGVGLRWMDHRIQFADDAVDLAEALFVGLSPALLLHWVVAAAVDYARVDLVRHPGMSALRSLARGFGVVARHRLALVHSLLYGAVFAGVTALYVWLSPEAATLLALVAMRQVAGLLRFAAHVALIAGQVELGCAAMATPFLRRR